MPECRPERPKLANGAERDVWEKLRSQLGPEEFLLSGLRVTDRAKDHEADFVVIAPGFGIVVVEVKGGPVWLEQGQWRMKRGGQAVPIDPVNQVRDAKYALRSYVSADPRWARIGNSRLRWAHAIVVPHTTLDADFAAPDCPRWSIIDLPQLDQLATLVRAIPAQQENDLAAPDEDQAALIAEILLGRGPGQRSHIAELAERESEVTRLTEEQAIILDATRMMTRVEVRGGAGSGKTWLAMEKARRLAREDQRVALLCYSRGLATYLKRAVATWPRNQRPAYVGTFHSLGTEWGATSGPDDDSEFWEKRLPEQMRSLAEELPPGKRFDAFVIDESQDFAESWWPVLLAAFRDEDTGGIYAFSDEGQRLFARYGPPPISLVPLVLDHNLRNTRQIADSFRPLAAMRMRTVGGEGPAVRFVPCRPDEAIERADAEVEQLLESEWRYEEIALLATGSRHPVHLELQQQGQDAYWSSFWENDDVFYGHVLSFKGLERPAVVLALNEAEVGERSKERLYVGMSRARDLLVVCGDPDFIRQVGGDQVLRRLGSNA